MGSPLLSCHLYLNVTFFCPVIENFKWNERFLRGHLSWKATFFYPRFDCRLFAQIQVVSSTVLSKDCNGKNIKRIFLRTRNHHVIIYCMKQHCDIKIQFCSSKCPMVLLGSNPVISKFNICYFCYNRQWFDKSDLPCEWWQAHVSLWVVIQLWSPCSTVLWPNHKLIN
jgi:hypothetical protein